ncbi:MAG: adenylyltransferase/cytidyltransferase family protein [Bacteroidetes bacterium]|nr:adenylyltransferase/cytidyltransferase family protein [Bacteroidota bacterium]
MKKIFVSGCYDMLHSGHVAFFEEAASLGELYVGIGSDKTIIELKGRSTINTEQERLYMIKALKTVKQAWINSGSGVLDFKEDLIRIRPDILFVNEDGHTSEKAKLCEELGIEYKISKRIPHANLPTRSTTALRQECLIPYRIDLAGGWLDQPYVSKFYPGAVITISIEPDYDFNDRSGMSTSTRKKAIELWHTDIPEGDKEKLAKILFCYENPPGSEYVSGSQDSLGIVIPGLNYLWYNNEEYWPSKIEKVINSEIISWLEERIYLLALQPRESGFSVTDNTDITLIKAKALAVAADQVWEAILKKDAKSFGKAMTASFNAQTSMFPHMVTSSVEDAIREIPEHVLGYKLSGAGGGGYLVLFSEVEIPNALKIRIRRD